MTSTTPTLLATPAEVHAEFARIVDELTRRGFLAGGLGSTALLGLTACGSSGSDHTPDSSTTPATRRLSGAYGDVVVPANPTRIVALPSAPLSTLLDIGVVAVGTDDDEADVMVPANKAKAAAIPSIGTYGSLNVEKIAALKPDLVIATTGWVDKSLYTKISAIAPTYVIDDSTQTWEQVAEQTAAAVGATAELAALKKTYAATLASVKSAHAAALSGNRWEVIQDADAGTFYRWMSNSDPSRILTALGATLGNTKPVGPKTSTIGAEISYENAEAELKDAQVILCPALSIKTLEGQPTITGLPAVKAGHLYASDWLFVFGYSAATALVNQIADICTHLT